MVYNLRLCLVALLQTQWATLNHKENLCVIMKSYC